MITRKRVMINLKMNSDLSSTAHDQLPALGSAGDDFYSMLGHAIDSAREDDVQLRKAIYEVVRARLQRQGWIRQPPVSILEMRQYLRALDAAIARIERDASNAEELRAAQTLLESIESSGHSESIQRPPHPGSIQSAEAKASDRSVATENELIATRDIASLPAFLSPASRPPLHVREPRKRGARTFPAIRLVVAVFLGGWLYAVFADRIEFSGLKNGLHAIFSGSEPTSKTAPTAGKQPSPEPVPADETAIPLLPLPTLFGVYAVSDGHLNELNPLPINVPDQRIFVSAPITSPSRTTLSDGRVIFVAFRRDFVTNAPERITIRVVARVMRTLTFDSAGKPRLANLDTQWAVRGNSYEFRVAPLANHPEMIVIRPESDDFVFPAGRYALVLNGQAYDFSVDGPITESVQCLERTEALNGAVYSECRRP
jgi:hypothetical protein